MAALSDHTHLRCADRAIKEAYVDLCMRKGERSNVHENRYKYYYKGLVVIASAALTLETQTVVTAFWTADYGQDTYEKLVDCAKRRKRQHKTSAQATRSGHKGASKPAQIAQNPN